MGHGSDARGMMYRAGFDKEKVRLAVIWAAKWRRCDTCHEPIGKPCINLAKKDRSVIKNPHESRIDWEMLAANLRARGYH